MRPHWLVVGVNGTATSTNPYGDPAPRHVYVAPDGLAWVDYASTLVTQHFPPPTCEEHIDGTHVFGGSLSADVNPVQLIRNALSQRRMEAVLTDKLRFVTKRTTPGVGCGTEVREYDYIQASSCLSLRVTVRYHVPFTASVKFEFKDAVTGSEPPPLTLWYSATPAGEGLDMHMRLAYGAKGPVPILECQDTRMAYEFAGLLCDWLFGRSDWLQDPWAWLMTGEEQTDNDDFVNEYGRAMARAFPEVLEYFL